MKLFVQTHPTGVQFFDRNNIKGVLGASNLVLWQWRNITRLTSKSTYIKRSQTKRMTSLRSRLEDEGDQGSWAYSSEWWGSNSDHLTRSVFRASSCHGNGVVSVLAYPSSIPSPMYWPKTDDWLQRRCAEICSDLNLKVIGYQWRVLRFNDITRQSAAKVMIVSDISDPISVYYMQQPHCLAKSYIKSMVSSGLTTLSSCNYNLSDAVNAKNELRVLCVGHGGGSLPLFVASKIQGAVVDSIEIDPVVVSASVRAMGFPATSVTAPSDHENTANTNAVNEVLWKGIHERLFLHESDAENFILNTENMYDIVFIDAYDGKDVFPRKLWDPSFPFLQALSSRLHPHHGTVIVNLHSSAVKISPDGKIVSEVCQAYKDTLVGVNSPNRDQFPGVGFVVSVPWVRNTTLVVCRGLSSAITAFDESSVSKSLMSKCSEVERALRLPFSCLDYITNGLVLLD